jgi:hypothetical protein
VKALSVVPARRVWVLASVAALAVGLSACGRVNNPSTEENDGVYVTAGPITYQLQVSRTLNPYATEDSQYIKGLPLVDRSIAARQLWYGVFLWAKNQTKLTASTDNTFDILDTEGRHYYPLPVSPSLNGYAWTPETLSPGGIQPAPNTQASFGPTQGGLLLFKLNQTVYDNRPLILEIRGGPLHKVWSTISLDL